MRGDPHILVACDKCGDEVESGAEYCPTEMEKLWMN
jgi:hypothetical protein